MGYLLIGLGCFIMFSLLLPPRRHTPRPPLDRELRWPSAKLMLGIELRGRLKRRHLKSEPWQRGCIKIVIKKLRRLEK